MNAPASQSPERVLVLMPTLRDAERSAVLLAEANIPCIACDDLASVCRELRVGAGALLLTDEALAGDAAGQLSEAIREQPAWSALPILVLAREGWSSAGPHLAPEVLRSLIVVERPVRTRTLVEIVSSALRGRRHQYQIRDELVVREQQAARLEAQEERLRFALAAGKLGAWELDIATHELHCSDMFKANFGYASSEPFTYAALQNAIHPLDKARVLAAIEHSIAESAEYDIEYRVLWPSGETRWLMVRGRATYDDAGKPLCMAGVSLDVTERKRMVDDLQQSRSELARQAEELRLASRRKDEFLATLAHELRNPLAPIRTGMELLTQSRDAKIAEHTLGVMQRQVGHMVRLIDDLLDVSRITSGKLQLKREPVLLSSIIEAAVEASRPLIERKQHTLRVSLPDAAVHLNADVTRIAQVVGNLLNNSSNYTNPGGLIELSARQEKNGVVIEVRDNGSGIPGERLNDIFEMFSQINPALERSQGGLGIGLALVRRLVEMHGGSVSAASPGPGLGSVFTIRLPLATDHQQASAAEQEAPASKGNGRKRVLVVDDNEDAAEMLALVLNQSGYHTKTAYEGRSAVAAAGEWSPQIVILDIGLPDMSGYEVASEIRRNDHSPALQLIALTGWGTQDDKQKALQAGFDVHLTKPVDTSELQRVLSELEWTVAQRKSAPAPRSDLER